MHINWKKTIIVTSDMLIAVYLLLAFTAFDKPEETARLCTKVNINIQDEATNGFINTREIKARLEKEQLYPLEKPMKYVNLRKMEETLKGSPFVKTAECYKTQAGDVNITLTQRRRFGRRTAFCGSQCQLPVHAGHRPGALEGRNPGTQGPGAGSRSQGGRAHLLACRVPAD